MGISSDGLLCFGIEFEEDVEFPWSEYGDDINEWWAVGVHGYKPSFELYDATGNYIDGVEPGEDVIKKYYDERREFVKSIPDMPVELVTHCSYEYPMYIIAATELCFRASRGYPVKVSFDVTNEQKESVVKFCKEFGIQTESDPCWILASLYR